MIAMKRVLLIVAMVVATSSIYGQNSNEKWRGLSVGAGFNISNVLSEVYCVDGYKSGYAIDLYSGYDISDIFSLDAGLQFNSIGGSNLWDDSQDNVTANYLSVPLDFNMKIYKGLYGSAGAYVSLLLKNHEYIWVENGAMANVGVGDDTYTFNTFDAGIRFKLFYQLERVRFTAGYSTGLLDVINCEVESSHVVYNKSISENDGKVNLASRNSLFYIGVGFKIF